MPDPGYQYDHPADDPPNEQALKHLQKEYLSINKSYKKLVSENRELQSKHEKVCAKVKTLKNEKELLLKELNKVSVAFTSSKKDFSENQKVFDKIVN